MSEPRLLLDEMMSARIAVQLRERGLDVQAVLERRELVAYPDEALLELATREERILVTTNLVDFGPLSQRWAADGRSHAGLVFISTKTFPEARDWIGAVSSALAQASEQRRLPDAGDVVWLRRLQNTGDADREPPAARLPGLSQGDRGGDSAHARAPAPRGNGRSARHAAD